MLDILSQTKHGVAAACISTFNFSDIFTGKLVSSQNKQQCISLKNVKRNHPRPDTTFFCGLFLMSGSYLTPLPHSFGVLTLPSVVKVDAQILVVLRHINIASQNTQRLCRHPFPSEDNHPLPGLIHVQSRRFSPDHSSKSSNTSALYSTSEPSHTYASYN